jgi:hypothetical protein
MSNPNDQPFPLACDISSYVKFDGSVKISVTYNRNDCILSFGSSNASYDFVLTSNQLFHLAHFLEMAEDMFGNISHFEKDWFSITFCNDGTIKRRNKDGSFFQDCPNPHEIKS